MKKKRPRTEARERLRAQKKIVRDKQKLASLENSRERPIEVTSSSVIPVRARATPCHQCGGGVQIVEERAETAELRAVEVECQRCGTRRVIWFRIGTPLAN